MLNLNRSSLKKGKIFRIIPGTFVSLSLMFLPHQLLAVPLDIGVALEFVEASATKSFEGGLGIQFGIELKEKDNWHYGAQLQYFDGWTKPENVISDTDMSFSSYSLYATAKNNNLPLIFRAGIIKADYRVPGGVYDDTGVALGFSWVLGQGNLRFHILDYQHYDFNGKSFNSVGLSILLLSGLK
jgi:hypothetical protein